MDRGCLAVFTARIIMGFVCNAFFVTDVLLKFVHLARLCLVYLMMVAM